MYTIAATFDGQVPLMMDRFYNPEEVEQGGAKHRGKDSWKSEWRQKAYMDKTGVYVPSDNIRMMLIGNKFRPGAAKILGSYIQKGKATQYVSMCKGAIWVLGPDDPQKVYVAPARKSLADDDYDERSFINATGSRSLCRRPIIRTPWRLTFLIQVVDDKIDSTLVRDLFDVAGLRCGVGAYGPTFGRCLVTDWAVLPPKKR